MEPDYYHLVQKNTLAVFSTHTVTKLPIGHKEGCIDGGNVDKTLSCSIDIVGYSHSIARQVKDAYLLRNSENVTVGIKKVTYAYVRIIVWTYGSNTRMNHNSD